MKAKQRLVWMCILLGLATLGCQTTVLEFVSPSGRALYSDDFEAPNGNWQEYELPEGQVEYAEGGLRFQIWEANSQLWSTPNVRFKDVHLEVEARKIDGGENDLFGLICRGQKAGGYYTFLISSDGYYGIGRLQDNQVHILGEGAMPPSEIIQQGQARNRIGADCTGDLLALWVNGVKLAEYRDVTYKSGDVGLFAGVLGAEGTEVVFDNFTVYKP
jgi:hypothetical protein